MLTPLLFSLYVNDLANYLICTLNLYTSPVQLFADDIKSYRTVYSVADAIAFQILFIAIDNWCDVW